MLPLARPRMSCRGHLHFLIKRLPSANLIWILVVGMESSIRTTALNSDFSSSGEEGVLTISGVRLRKKN